jgi:type II secretory pathway predicted ATPase ExeA
LTREGGFALCTGDPGTGKSVALRLLIDRLRRNDELKVGVLTRPQSRMADFYREMGEIFGVQLSPHNRFAGSKVLHERWRAHIQEALFRPVLVVDEAQEMQPTVLNELRLLSSVELDSQVLLTVVLAGDARLTERLRDPDLLPLATRIRARLAVPSATPAELGEYLRHVLEQAGNRRLMSDELITTLCEHAAGNPRILMTMGSELLEAAHHKDVHQIDEQLYLEVFAVPAPAGASARKTGRAGARP